MGFAGCGLGLGPGQVERQRWARQFVDGHALAGPQAALAVGVDGAIAGGGGLRALSLLGPFWPIDPVGLLGTLGRVGTHRLAQHRQHQGGHGLAGVQRMGVAQAGGGQAGAWQAGRGQGLQHLAGALAQGLGGGRVAARQAFEQAQGPGLGQQRPQCRVTGLLRQRSPGSGLAGALMLADERAVKRLQCLAQAVSQTGSLQALAQRGQVDQQRAAGPGRAATQALQCLGLVRGQLTEAARAGRLAGWCLGTGLAQALAQRRQLGGAQQLAQAGQCLRRDRHGVLWGHWGRLGR